MLPDYQLKIADLYNIQINKRYYIWKSNGKLNSNLCVCECVCVCVCVYVFVLCVCVSLCVCVEIILPSCWFSLNRSEMVKAVTLAFCSIQ